MLRVGEISLESHRSMPARLKHVSDEKPGLTRKMTSFGFRYFYPDGRPVRDRALVKRINALAIPPAYTDVWICPDPRGHIQATGRDVRGRKQYRYHPKWTEIRSETKFERLIEFAERLPQIRAGIEEDIARRGMKRDRVLATIVWLLDQTLIRIGNDRYRRDNKSFGLTTLLNRHVEAGSSALKFNFVGKSGKAWKLSVQDRRIARVVRACQEIPGQHLFQYIDEDGSRCPVDSGDVNEYIRDTIGQGFTAKHFRTWAGTVTALDALGEEEAPSSKAQATRRLNAAVDRVAERLVNTRAISRKCYIHPAVIDSYLEGSLVDGLKDARRRVRPVEGLEPEEALTLKFLKLRLAAG
jgi:DNA topoisomerase-1